MAYTKVIRTYRFKDKDPVCDEVASLVDQAGLRGKKHVGKIATLSTLAYGTVDALLYGETKRPHNATIMAIATSLGYERVWQLQSMHSRGSKEFDLRRAPEHKAWLAQELENAKAFIKAQAKLREKSTPKKKRASRKTKLRLVSSRAA